MAPDTTPPELPVRNELLWIPHDAGSIKDSSHKRSIFSHVQSNHRAQKLRAEAKALRVSALRGRTASLKDLSLRRVAQQGERSNVDRRDGRTYPKRRENDQIIALQDPNDARIQLTRPSSPLSPLGKGNSDPFHVYSIPIGPEENSLFTLYRDHILPSVYFLSTRSKNMNDQNLNELASRDWRDNVSGLDEKGTALGTLARFGAMASRFNPHMKEVTLSFLGPSTRILRGKVLAKQALDNHIDCLHINMLFNTEIITENVAGAVAHGTMLLHIFKLQWSQQRLDYKMLLYELHNDLQLTSTFLVRPIFDVENWLPEVLKPLWDAASPHFEAHSNVEEDLDTAIQHEVLIHWFKLRRQMIRYEGLSADDERVPPLPLVTASLMASSFLFHSRMINLYLDLEDELKHDGLSEDVRSRLYAQQCLALAGAHLRRFTGYRPKIRGVPVYDDTRFVNALKHALEQCEATSACLDVDKYRKARIWALYIGALVERGSVTEQTRTCQQWFNRKLAESALKTKINTWDQLRIMLKRFLYEGSLMSQGSVWFEELLLSYQTDPEQGIESDTNWAPQ
ncbi:hypothetical protein H2200_005392 [Cladophialophora chaetospira]|uniref:Uncharacterized protein n=1 Tax=Cladophialophora chaetospira TaxID=386627 RepID=A0AA38XBW5_9EURO|nr:hypothetical protein H2200_005392 [Cladophialophora chaetospira]